MAVVMCNEKEEEAKSKLPMSAASMSPVTKQAEIDENWILVEEENVE